MGMTGEEAIKRLKEARNTIQPFLYVDEAIDYAIKALEQQSSDDCISRDEVKKTIDNLRSTVGNDIMDGIITENNINWLTFEVEQLPSVTPQPKIEKMEVEECYTILRTAIDY